MALNYFSRCYNKSTDYKKNFNFKINHATTRYDERFHERHKNELLTFGIVTEAAWIPASMGTGLKSCSSFVVFPENKLVILQ